MTDESRASYNESFEPLRNVYLEDSWVLGFGIEGDVATFDLDAVLTPEHPEFHPPSAGEQYCYARLRLTVAGIASFDPSGAPPATDATKSIDLGNIDSFVRVGDGRWRIEGDWGVLEAKSPAVAVDTHDE